MFGQGKTKTILLRFIFYMFWFWEMVYSKALKHEKQEILIAGVSIDFSF